MSTLRRMTRTANKPGLLTEDQKDHLLKGYTLLDITEPWFEKMGFPFRSESHRKELYFQHRDELLEITGPDKRCHAWWCYEAKERRRIVSGDESLCMWSKGTFFGKCRVYDIEHWDDQRRPFFESQSDYLKRHGLAAS